MSKFSKLRNRTVLASMACAVLLCFGTMPANAAVSKTVSVGSSPSVLALTSIENINGNTVAISYSPEFTNHSVFSVYVTSFRICFSMTGGGATLIKPQVRDASTIYAEYDFLTMWSGTCQSFPLNRTFQAAPGMELFRIVGMLGGNGGPEGSTVGGFNR